MAIGVASRVLSTGQGSGGVDSARSASRGAKRRRLLVVEDDFAIASNLYTWLDRAGYEVELAYTGHAGLHQCSVGQFDLMLLDVGLPGLDGLVLLQRLRSELRSNMPVLVISARNDLSDKLAGFAHGADDYLTKPFALAEVEARVAALLKRSQSSSECVRQLGTLSFDAGEGRASVAGTVVRLTPMATRLLEMLMQRPGQLVRRQQIHDALWQGEPPNPDAVRSQVHWLRRALSEAGFDGIETVHGVGWRLVERPGA